MTPSSPRLLTLASALVAVGVVASGAVAAGASTPAPSAPASAAEGQRNADDEVEDGAGPDRAAQQQRKADRRAEQAQRKAERRHEQEQRKAARRAERDERTERRGERTTGEAAATPPPSGPAFVCDPALSHGQNVSAYARSLPAGPGRGRLVSQAARSDCGKGSADD